MGGSELHQLLYELDEDMRDLFRVKADFDVEMEWGADEAHRYAAFRSLAGRDGRVVERP